MIRVQKQGDYELVQNLVRDAFWNLHCPGTDKHYNVRLLRNKNIFIPELSLVATQNQQIVGQIIYYRTRIIYGNGTELQTVTFGPVSVRSDLRSQGIGSALIKQSLNKAKHMGFKAVIIFGYPEYYNRFGFTFSKHFNIKSQDNKYMYGMQVLELQEGYLLKNEEGVFKCDYPQYDQMQLQAYDQNFPYKQKYETKSQQVFKIVRGLLWNQNLNASQQDKSNTQKIEST